MREKKKLQIYGHGMKPKTEAGERFERRMSREIIIVREDWGLVLEVFRCICRWIITASRCLDVQAALRPEVGPKTTLKRSWQPSRRCENGMYTVMGYNMEGNVLIDRSLISCCVAQQTSVGKVRWLTELLANHRPRLASGAGLLDFFCLELSIWLQQPDMRRAAIQRTVLLILQQCQSETPVKICSDFHTRLYFERMYYVSV